MGWWFDDLFYFSFLLFLSLLLLLFFCGSGLADEFEECAGLLTLAATIRTRLGFMNFSPMKSTLSFFYFYFFFMREENIQDPFLHTIQLCSFYELDWVFFFFSNHYETFFLKSNKDAFWLTVAEFFSYDELIVRDVLEPNLSSSGSCRFLFQKILERLLFSNTSRLFSEKRENYRDKKWNSRKRE